MEKTIPVKKLKALSASRVKTLENCSWLYWCNYHLKLPQEPNNGAKKGSICHTVFELLLRKNRVHHFQKILKEKTITAVPSIERLIKKHIKKLHVHSSAESLLHIDMMILVGLQNDFYVKDATLISPEYKFDLINEEHNFRIKGFMDKVFRRGKELIIDDFKSSKKKFSGEDQESNLQALFYSYAAKQIWPDAAPTVRFIFLQYPRDAIMSVQFTDETLLGFKYYLEATQQKVEGFNEFVAKGHFAADEPAGTDTFSGKSLCGWATKAGQLKKDGTKMWHCPFRFGFDYYVLLDKDKEIIKTAFKKEELPTPKKGEKIEIRRYAGCPKHINPLDDFKPLPVIPPKKVYGNVLDELWD